MGAKTSKEGDYLLETITEHTGSISCFALSEDQSLLVTGSEDCTIGMWSAKTSQMESIGILKGHTDYVTCVTVCDTYVISGAADCTVRKWDMTTCECLFKFIGHKSRISRVIATGEFIFSTSYDKTAKAWIFEAEDDEFEEEDENPDIGDEKACIRTFSGHERGVYSIIFIPAQDQSGVNEEGLNINPSDYIITGSADGTARCWSFDTGGTLKVFVGHRGPIMTMTTCPTGDILYTGSEDNDIRSWDISTGRCLRTMEGHQGPVMCMTVVNRLMYSGSQDGKARCWVREFGDCTKAYKGHKHSIGALKFNEGILYTASGDTFVRAYDVKTGVVKRVFQGHDAAVTCLVIVGEKLITGSFDNTIRVWDLSDINRDVNADEHTSNTTESHGFEDKQNQRLEDLENQLDSYVDEDVGATALPIE